MGQDQDSDRAGGAARRAKPRWRRWVRRGLIWSAVIIIGGPILAIAHLMFSMRPLHGPSFLVDVTVEMEVNGEPVRIEKTVKCRTFEVPGGEALARLWKRAPTRYAPTVGAFGQRLTDGSAVMLWNPYRCARIFPEGRENMRNWDVYPLPEGALPYIAWTPDIENPETLEFYIHSSYFERPDARIRNVRMHFEKAPRGAKPSPPDEFDGFTSHRLNPESSEDRGGGGGFRTFAAVVLERDDWQGLEPEFDAALANYSEPLTLPFEELSNGETIAGIARQIFETHFETSSVRSWLPQQWRYEPLILHGDEYSSAAYQIMAVYDQSLVVAELFTLQPGKDAILVDKVAPTGMVILRRRYPEYRPRGYGDSYSVPYKRGEHYIKPDRAFRTSYTQNSNYLYDPSTGDLFWINIVSLSFYPLEGHTSWFDKPNSENSSRIER